MTEPTDRQHELATEHLHFALNSRQGKNTHETSKQFGVSQRTVQVALKRWREGAYRSLYSINVVETDKLVNGKHCGVTKYTWEGKNE